MARKTSKLLSLRSLILYATTSTLSSLKIDTPNGTLIIYYLYISQDIGLDIYNLYQSL